MGENSTIAALAVLGSAPLSLLNQLIKSNLHQEEAAAILAGAGVVESDGRLTMKPDTAAAYLKALESEDFLHFRHLHEQALYLLAGQLRAGDRSYEPSFVAVFIRLAERLFNQAPQELADLIDNVRSVPVSQPTRDYMLLFEGVAWRNLERYDDATARFTALVERPDLDLDVRGRALNALGISRFWQGQLQSALDSYAASLTIWRQLGDSVQEAMVHLNIGIAAYELHEYERLPKYS